MDNKRVIIALVLSFAVLFGWQYMFPPPKPTTPPPAAEQKQEAAPAPAQQIPPAPVADYAPVPGRAVTVKTPLFTAVLNSSGGVLERFSLERFKEDIRPESRTVDMVGDARVKAPLGIILGGVPTWHMGQWGAPAGDLTLADGETKTLTFVGDSAGFRIERKLTFQAGSYLVREELTLTNLGGTPVQTRMSFTAASKTLSGASDSYNPTRVEYLFDKKSMTENDHTYSRCDHRNLRRCTPGR